MQEGIAIVGLNGSGKSTLGHALAKALNYYEIDVEDYYFPEQQESRKEYQKDRLQCDSTRWNASGSEECRDNHRKIENINGHIIYGEELYEWITNKT